MPVKPSIAIMAKWNHFSCEFKITWRYLRLARAITPTTVPNLILSLSSLLTRD